jgi:hypothetical protein
MAVSGDDVFWLEFAASLQNPDMVGHGDKLLSHVIASISEYSASITDLAMQAEFNRGADVIIAKLKSKLLPLQTSLDEVQSERKLLKKQIDEAGQIN